MDVANAQAAYDQSVAGVQTAQLNVLKAEQSYQQLQQQYYAQFTTTITTPPTTRPPITLPTTTNPPTTNPPPSSSTTTATSPTTTTTGTPDTLPGTTTTGTLSSSQTPVQLAAFVVAAAPTGSGSGSGSTTGSTITSLDLRVAQQQIVTAQLAVTTAQNAETQASLNLQQAQQDAAARTVVAPVNGEVTVLNVSDGDIVTGTGSTAKSNSTQGGTGGGTGGTSTGTGSSSSTSAALEISNPGLMNAVVQLNEVDVTQLKGGEKATMTFDAVSGLTLAGSVTAIDTVGTVTQGVVTYNVTVGFDATGTTVRPGMTVTAAIVTNVAPDVLYVPNAAVKTSGNGQYVQVIAGVSQAPVQKTVQVGIATDTYTQIVSGVNEGDNVVTQTIDPNTTATTARSSGGLGIPGLGGGAARGAGGAGFRGPGG